MKTVVRCSWCNTRNPLYVEYHDHEWGVPQHDDARLHELLLLEIFQAGLSWECVLNKREAFRQAFDGFDARAIARYSSEKIDELMHNPGIIRNRRKMDAAVRNAGAFLNIAERYGSFDKFIWGFTSGCTIVECGMTRSVLSDRVSRALKDEGMSFVGSVTVYAYLQAIGVINGHDAACFLHH